MNEKTELVTTTTMPMDGIDGYTDATIGEETKQSGLFPGTRIKFSRESEWEINDEPLDPALRLLLNDVKRIITRWGHDKRPAEKPVVLEPGEPWPDVKAWNEALPRSEWVAGFNGPQGPWRPTQIVHFLDPRSMRQFHWADDTTGGKIAIRDIVGSITKMRRFRPGAMPVVEFSTTYMPTAYGGRQRPHFEIHNWIAMPGEEPQPAALPAPAAEPASSAGPPIIEAEPVVEAAPVIEGKAEPVKAPAAKPAKKKRIGTLDVAKPLTPIKPVTLREELDDEIPI
jgi:hypothetical protein